MKYCMAFFKKLPSYKITPHFGERMQTTKTTSDSQEHAMGKAATTQERKYFEIFPDMNISSAPPLVWVNEKQIRVGFRLNSQSPFEGLNVQTAPQITFDRGRRRGKLCDAYFALLGQWFFSDRLKNLLEQLDPKAFVFVEAQVDYSKFDEPSPAYWFCDLVRKLDFIDDEKFKYTLYDEVDFKAYKALMDIKMRVDVVGHAHAFRLVHKHGAEIFDDVFVQAMAAAKIRAWRFEPIQQF